jgi:hypothetical protein
MPIYGCTDDQTLDFHIARCHIGNHFDACFSAENPGTNSFARNL